MSPKLTGIKEVDRARIENCAELSLFAAEKLLRPGGNLVIKVFKSNEIDRFVQKERKKFTKFVRKELKSTRRSSQEYYLVGLGFKPEV